MMIHAQHAGRSLDPSGVGRRGWASLRVLLIALLRSLFSRARYRLLAAGPIDEPAEGPAREPPAGLRLVRSTAADFDVTAAGEALSSASQLDGLDERGARGEELWALSDGVRFVVFGWVTRRGRVVGLRRCRVAEGRAFLFDFHTLPGWKGRNLQEALLRLLRHHLGDEGRCQLIIDVVEGDEESLRAATGAGFASVAHTAVDELLGRLRFEPRGATRELAHGPAADLFEGGALLVGAGSGSGPVALSGGTSDLSVEVVRDGAAWASLREPWQSLWAVSPTASPPLSWDWLRLWWQHYGRRYGDGHDSLRVLLVRRRGELLGALPLYQQRSRLGLRHLALLSTGEREVDETCPDYLDVLHRPGEGERVAAALWQALFASPVIGWDRLQLDDLSIRSPLRAWSDGMPAGVRVWRFDRGACFISDVRGGLEALYQRLPSRRRSQPRRVIKGLDASGATLGLAATPDETDRYFDEMVALHQARWNADGRPGAFAAARFTGFHRALARALVPAGKAVLARLWLRGVTLAVLYGFVTGREFHFYQAGVALDRSGPLRSPGIGAHLALMRHLAGQGIEAYDFLRGAATYKLRLATDEAPMFSLRFQRDGLRAGLFEAGELALSVARRAARLVGAS